MKMFARVLSLVAVLTAAFAVPAFATLQVNVNEGNLQPLPIAIPDFNGAAGQNIANVVRADLERSGIFKPLDPKSFLDKIANINVPPNFANWRVINAQALVTGEATTLPDGRLRVAFRLWDVFGGSEMVDMAYTTAPESWRRVAHIISDAIYQRITGEKGYFDSRIVYIAERGPLLNRKKLLAIMDEDGYNPTYLTDGAYMVLTPRFDPTSNVQRIAYMSYIAGKPRVYLFDIDSGHQQMLGEFTNMTFSPRFSPDGNKVVMSLEKGGVSNIYTMDLRSRSVTQLTNDHAIDTSPSYSPDGKQITFESDRGGTQQIYVMNSDGSGVHRVSFGAGRNATPVWSPRGDLIAFTKQDQGVFDIGVMRPDGSGEHILSTGWQDEGPTWAPNGRVLMFTRTLRGGRGSEIWQVDATGRNERKVLTQGDASDPAWSPLIQ